MLSKTVIHTQVLYAFRVIERQMKSEVRVITSKVSVCILCHLIWWIWPSLTLRAKRMSTFRIKTSISCTQTFSYWVTSCFLSKLPNFAYKKLYQGNKVISFSVYFGFFRQNGVNVSRSSHFSFKFRTTMVINRQQLPRWCNSCFTQSDTKKFLTNSENSSNSFTNFTFPS